VQMSRTNHHDWMCCGYGSGNKNGTIGAAALLYTLVSHPVKDLDMVMGLNSLTLDYEWL
jgi:hypothetical protein